MADLVYIPPGVTVDENAQPVPNISGNVAIPPSLVALVGPSIGYQTYTEPILLSATTPVTLTQTGIDTTNMTVTSLAGAARTASVDYTVAQTGSPAEESVTTIARIGGGAISDGETVYVTYRYTNSGYYLPFLSRDWDQIQSRFGAAIVSATGAVGSPLSLAAKIVMEQGVRELILLPTKGSTPTSVTAAQINTAYAALESRDDVGLVVPVGVGIVGSDVAPGDTTSLIQNLKTHVESMSAEGKYRMGVVGLDAGATRTHSTLAQATSSKRIVLGDPNILNWYNGYTNTTMELGGVYLGAALAGMMASRPPQDPLTKKIVRSFPSIPNRIFAAMTKTAKDDMSNSGVTVVEQSADGRLSVRHGVTTDRSSVLTREISIVRAKDTLIRLIYQALDQAGIVGSALTAETPIRVRSIVDGALTQAQNAGIFVGYSNLAVRVSDGDATSIQVKFAYRPAYPVNYITVSFSINTVTGNQSEV